MEMYPWKCEATEVDECLSMYTAWQGARGASHLMTDMSGFVCRGHRQRLAEDFRYQSSFPSRAYHTRRRWHHNTSDVPRSSAILLTNNRVSWWILQIKHHPLPDSPSRLVRIAFSFFEYSCTSSSSPMYSAISLIVLVKKAIQLIRSTWSSPSCGGLALG